MRPFDPVKHGIIKATFRRFPGLSDRAVARLTNASPETVARVRAIHGIVTGRRVEASGRPARGRQQTLRYDEDKSDDSAALYRAFRHQQLLYVGVSWTFLRRLATHGRRPWWPEITNVTVTHCAHTLDAREAERIAIEQEQPKYNTVGKARAKSATAPRRSGTGTAAVTTPRPEGRTAGPIYHEQTGESLVRRPTGRTVYRLVKE